MTPSERSMEIAAEVADKLICDEFRIRQVQSIKNKKNWRWFRVNGQLFEFSLGRSKKVIAQALDKAILDERERSIKLTGLYWKFDEKQMPISSWHDKQDCLEAIRNQTL